MKRSLPFILITLAFFLTACNVSLAEDITPPPGYQPPAGQAQPVAVSGPVFPPVPPDPANGQPIYAEKCAPCHGELGLGDGPQGNELPNQPAPLGNANFARQKTPAEWYNIVTQGNLDAFMPPFNSLSDRERWDVVAYSFSLSMPQDRLDLGREVYEANCASCHGPQGFGDGPDAAALDTPLPDFSNPEFMAETTIAGFYQVVSEGSSSMPAFAGELSEDQRWSVSEYVRWLSFAAGQAGQVAAAPLGGTAEATTLPPKATQSPESSLTQPLTSTAVMTGTVPGINMGVVQGTVTNASGGDVPEGVEVTLHGFDQMQMAATLTTTTGADGVYRFTGVEMPEGRAFLATLEYQGATYGSEIGRVQAGTEQVDLPIVVYDTTTDRSVLVVDRLHLFFEFLDEQTVRVIELYIVSNTSTKTVVSPGEGEPTLEFSLPEGAVNLQFQDGALGDRYVQTNTGFGDTLAVRPGSGSYQVLFAYEMPYNRRLEISHPVQLPTNAVVVLVPEGSVKVDGEDLVDAGVRPVEGTEYRMYNSAGLAAGESVDLVVTGRPTGVGATLSTGSTSNLLVGVGALGVALVAAGVYLYRRSQRLGDEEEWIDEQAPASMEGEEEDADTLMDAILALDDLYKAGELPEEAYLQRRAELKARLRELME